MPVPDKFHQPWSEIDPSLQHGGIPDGGLDTDFVGPRLGDNTQTKNIDLVRIFRAANDCAAALSMHPEADKEGPPLRNLVEETLKALNWVMERIADRTRTAATPMFIWEHAIPPMINYMMRPIRFPVRNDFANEVLYHFIGEQVEIAENNTNALHSSLDPSSGHDLINPLFHLKGNIIRDFFDQEVAGEITLEELQAIFEGVAKIGPTIVPPGQSQPAPPDEKVTEALGGVEVLQWYPTAAHWTVFAKKQAEQYKTERIWQPEGARRTTEDVAPESPVPGAPITLG